MVSTHGSVVPLAMFCFHFRFYKSEPRIQRTLIVRRAALSIWKVQLSTLQYRPLFCWFLFWLNRTAVLQFTMRMLISNNKIQRDCKNLRLKVVVSASCWVVDESEESIGDGEYQWVEGVGKPPRPGQKKTKFHFLWRRLKNSKLKTKLYHIPSFTCQKRKYQRCGWSPEKGVQRNCWSQDYPAPDCKEQPSRWCWSAPTRRRRCWTRPREEKIEKAILPHGLLSSHICPYSSFFCPPGTAGTQVQPEISYCQKSKHGGTDTLLASKPRARAASKRP